MSTTTTPFGLVNVGKNKNIEILNVVSTDASSGKIKSHARLTQVIDTLNFVSDTLDINVTQGSANVRIDIPSDFAIGPTGKQGPRGMTGQRGPKGDTGLKGPHGIQGATGPQGKNGPKGIKGDTGMIGPNGLVGSTGPTGLCDCEITTIQTSGPAGTKSLVSGKTGPHLLIKGITGKHGARIIDNTSFLTIETLYQTQNIGVGTHITSDSHGPIFQFKGFTGDHGIAVIPDNPNNLIRISRTNSGLSFLNINAAYNTTTPVSIGITNVGFIPFGSIGTNILFNTITHTADWVVTNATAQFFGTTPRLFLISINLAGNLGSNTLADLYIGKNGIPVATTLYRAIPDSVGQFTYSYQHIAQIITSDAIAVLWQGTVLNSQVTINGFSLVLTEIV